MEDIETKIDLLLDMYKEDREQNQSKKASSVVGHDETNNDNGDKQLSEPSSPRSQRRVKPMLRNLSDLGPRIKKRVTYSASATCSGSGGRGILSATTIDHKLPCIHVATPPQHHPSVVSEEDEDLNVGQQTFRDAAVDDIKPISSDASPMLVIGQPDVPRLQRHVSADFMSDAHYVTPSQQPHIDTNGQLYKLPTYQLTSRETSLN